MKLSIACCLDSAIRSLRQESVTGSAVGVQLERAVSFTAVPATGGGYTFTIPRELFLVQVIDRRDGELERSLRRPSEDVTGIIDLEHKTAQLHFVLVNLLHFQVPPGCGPQSG